jgi:hypothetical protein
MDEFKVGTGCKTQVFLGIVYTLVVLGGAIALLSTGMYKMTDAGPIIFLALLAWLAYDIYKFAKAIRYKVQVSDEGIRVKGVYKNWQEISSAEIRKISSGMRPAIVLRAADQTELTIPGGINGRDYISALVEKHVQNVLKK